MDDHEPRDILAPNEYASKHYWTRFVPQDSMIVPRPTTAGI